MEFKIAHYYNGILPLEEDEGFLTDVIYGSRLQKMVEDIKEYKKRECYKDIYDYIYSGNNQRVLILYGLSRTGKTTLIKQLISEMNSEDFKRSAIIQIKSSDTLREVNNIQYLNVEDYLLNLK
jgi:predicted AAA+ superfamily ATPase